MINRFFLFAFSFYTLASFSQDNSLFCEQVSALNTLIESKHYAPKLLNDETSKGIFDLFIERLDSEKELFLQEDIESFKAEEYKFDDYIKTPNCDFISTYTSTLEKRINVIKSKLEDLREQPLDYSGTLTLQFTPKKEFTFIKNDEDLNKRLQKRISYKIITKLIDEHEDIKSIETNFNALELEAKEKIINNELCLLDEIVNKNAGLQRFVEEAFLNAFVKVNDPNSTFFNNTEKITYESQLSKSQLSFGIITQKNNNGDIVVAHVIPGSAAFKNGKFEENDIIKSLSTSNTALEILCVSNEDVNRFLDKEEHKMITFSIKKKNGTLQDITLSKSKIKVEENSVRGYIINDDSKFGYIKIPSFYTNEESPNGRGLTADIAKELYKLQKENINGLVLDLRFNGGGSMQEAIELSGMFIDRGPVAIITSKNGENYTIRDNKRGSFFNKPLLVLVNEFSASASELFAAAMQDYNRAIIVGSQTFGKSSAQTIIPISETKNLGFSKLTGDVFYRATGKSHQSVGIIPDVVLPSLYNNFETAESFKANALKNDTTTVRLKHKPLKTFALTEIVEKSNTRTTTESSFKEVTKINKTLYNLLFIKGERYSLTLKNIAEEREKRKSKMDFIFNEDKEKPTVLTITNTKSTAEILDFNIEDKKENEETIKELSQDIYIKEAKHILTDYINSTNN